MLAKTHTDPKNGMKEIEYYCFHTFAKSCRRNWIQAFIQAIYVQHRQKDVRLPYDVKEILERDEIEEYAETVINENWEDGSDFTRYTEGELLAADDGYFSLGFELSEDEKETLIEWDSLRSAADYFGWRIKGYDYYFSQKTNIFENLSLHEKSFGKLAPASCPMDYFYECQEQTDNIEQMRLFRMVCAVRSMVGGKRFTGTTKDMLRARMIGAKKPATAEAMAAKCETLLNAQKDMEGRKRFDRILQEGAVRGFYTKYGAGRRVYLSTSVKDVDQLAQLADSKRKRHRTYQEQERKARQKQGYTKGTP